MANCGLSLGGRLLTLISPSMWYVPCDQASLQQCDQYEEWCQHCPELAAWAQMAQENAISEREYYMSQANDTPSTVTPLPSPTLEALPSELPVQFPQISAAAAVQPTPPTSALIHQAQQPHQPFYALTQDATLKRSSGELEFGGKRQKMRGGSRPTGSTTPAWAYTAPAQDDPMGC